MALLLPVHILILPTIGESKILCELKGHTKIIQIFISDSTIRTGVPDFRHLLPKFAMYLTVWDSAVFETPNIPNNIVNVFKFVYNQINNGTPLRNVVNDLGQHLCGLIEPVQSYTNNTNFSQAATAVLHTLNSNQNSTRDHWQRLVTDLGNSLIGLAQPSNSTLQSSSVGSLNSTELSRFVENRQNATREIIPISELEQIHPNSGVNQIEPPQAMLQNVSQKMSNSRTKIDLDIISKLAKFIYSKILANKTKPPKFTKKTRTNFRKIKNFIHHHTNIWLSKNEIEIFINEIEKFNDTISTQEIDIYVN